MSIKEKVQQFFGRRINEKGQEVPDPTPVELPIGYKHPKTLDERIMAMVRNELSSLAEKQGFESWEEANDFDMEDDELKDVPDDEYSMGVGGTGDPYVEEAARKAKEDLGPRIKKHRQELAAKKAAKAASKGSEQTSGKQPQ